jgi:hypothetical protein
MPHSSGDLREAFCDMIEDVFNSPGSPRDRWPTFRDEGGRSPDQLCGLLWNCNDICPGDVCDNADTPRGSTYAQVARNLRHWAAQA